MNSIFNILTEIFTTVAAGFLTCIIAKLITIPFEQLTQKEKDVNGWQLAFFFFFVGIFARAYAPAS